MYANLEPKVDRGKPWRYLAVWVRFASGLELLPAPPLAAQALFESRASTCFVLPALHLWLRFASGLELLPALRLAAQAFLIEAAVRRN